MRTEIRARRRPLKMALLVLWLAVFALVVDGAVTALTGPEPYPSMALMAVWLLMWTVGAVVASGSLAWMLWGREVVETTESALTIRGEIAGVGRTRSFDLGKVSDVRATARGVEFNYGLRRRSFGADLDRDAAEELAARFKDRS